MNCDIEYQFSEQSFRFDRWSGAQGVDAGASDELTECRRTTQQTEAEKTDPTRQSSQGE
jgi:hypothetical protein